MLGLMMDCPLLISGLLTYADRHHGDVEIASRVCDGIHRYTYHDAHTRTRRLANALKTLGARDSDRIATLAWNSFRHFEIYYAVSGSGMITHTVNPRLFPEQISWIINHAEDKILFLDPQLLPMVSNSLFPVARLCSTSC